MKRYYIVIYIFLNVCGFAQTYSYNDAQLWLNIYLEKKISNRFSAHVNQQDRWTSNVSLFNFAYADIGLTYKINKHIKIMTDYVFTEKRSYVIPISEGMLFRTVHQFYVALSMKKDIRRWRFMYRNMYQFQYNSPYTSYTGLIPFQYDRNKITVKYQYNKYLTYYIAEEVYIPLNSPLTRGIDRSRTFFGLFYNIFRHQQLELYFMYQDRIQNTIWFKQKRSYNYNQYILEKDFVYGIGYSFEF
ncbi:MAG TPA: DUF2490 domain-containing protein [Bacteroidia bacterium]|jgi:hypothetical protein|nr:DUF2490 domain-containing protein [Bacteroidia bacterium]